MATSRLKAYSYLRFSTPEQRQGDSFRRQAEAARKYADEHRLELDTELTFQDLGVSAFRGANAQVGSLKAFRSAVESGKIEKGSYLLLEGFDRLSRMDPWDALPIFQEIINAGITIVTLTDGREWTRKGLRDNPFRIMESLLVMMRANEESRTKSSRLKEAWSNKRKKAQAEGHKLTSKVPGWLKLNKATNSFELIKPRAAVVKRIFSEYLEGTGAFTIARRFNAEKVRTFGKADAWHEVYIQKILHNEAVIGRYQPKRRFYVEGKRAVEKEGPALEGYFPAVVSEADFYKAQSLFPAATGKKGKPLANLLTGLVFCASCGGKMHYVSRGKAVEKWTYLCCDNARRKLTCEARKGVRYDAVNSAVLRAIRQPEGRSKKGVALSVFKLMQSKEDRSEALAERKAAIEGQIAAEEAAITNLIDTLARLPSPAIERQLVEREALLRQRRKELEELSLELREAERGNEPLEDAQKEAAKFWQSVRNMPAAERTTFTNEARIRMNGVLKKLIARVEIEPGQVKLRLKGIGEPMVLELQK